MEQHSVIGPSGMYRTVPCTGSVQMIQMHPEPPSTDADEGDAAHWVAGEFLTGTPVTVGTTAPNGVIVTDDMLRHVAAYTEPIARTVVGMINLLIVEQLVTIERIHADCFGTPDCWYYDHANRKLYIWDFKYGWGIVEVFENWQLIAYAAGIVDYLCKQYAIQDTDITVDMYLIQPRPYHVDGPVRLWSTQACDLRPYINQASNACHIAMGGEPTLKSGPHCANCSAIYKCTPGHRAAMNAIDVSFQSITPQPHTIDIDLERVKQAEKRLKNLRVGMEAAAVEMIVKGQPLRNYSVDRTAGKKVWSKSNEEIYIMGDLMGKELRKPDSPITPIQAGNLGIPDDTIAAYSRTESSGYKLVKTNYKKVQEILCKS